jgi:hypothetical protein
MASMSGRRLSERIPVEMCHAEPVQVRQAPMDGAFLRRPTAFPPSARLSALPCQCPARARPAEAAPRRAALALPTPDAGDLPLCTHLPVGARAGRVRRWWHLRLGCQRRAGLVSRALPATGCGLSAVVAGGPHLTGPRVLCNPLRTQSSAHARPAGIGMALSRRTDRPEGWAMARQPRYNPNGSVGAVWEAGARSAQHHASHTAPSAWRPESGGPRRTGGHGGIPMCSQQVRTRHPARDARADPKRR